MKFLRKNRLFLALFIPFITIPWIRLGDYHLLLFNFPHNRLEIAGFGIETGTYALIALTLLLGVGVTLLSALTISRFYCGTLCTNTFFAHFLTLFKGKKKSILSKVSGFSFLAFLASTLAFSVVAYGISTHELIDALTHLTLAGWLVITLSLFMLAEVYMVQGWYCAYLCPYGATCAILPVDDRLTYAFKDPEHRCTDCGACVKICPIPALDIREGFDTRCIQCGMCKDACAKIFANSDKKSLIVRASRSVFSAGGRGKGPMMAIIAVLAASILGIVALLDTARLDSCLLENRPLHTQTSAR